MIRLGSVSFINAKPLTFALEKRLIDHDFEVILTPPSILSEMLCTKEIDLGLIPVAELLKRQNYRVVPDISISSYGKVDSVILLAKKDLTDARTVAVDSRSQSSTALLRIILEIFNGVSPVYLPRETGNDFLKDVDAGMLIGDTGLEKASDPPEGYRVYDLGEIWSEHTGLPFVYAVFAVNEGVTLGENLKALQRSKDYGLGTVGKIAKLESVTSGIDEEICFKYLTERIMYDLGEKEVEGIVKYSEYLSRLGESKKISGIKLY